jgi:mannan endo-1,4-beta-mannosidase
MNRRSLEQRAVLSFSLFCAGCVGMGQAVGPGAFAPITVKPTERASPHFVRGGKPFCFAGTNNYYLMYKDEAAVVDVLDAAVEMNLKVIRTWAFLDRGSLDGSVRDIHGDGHKDGVYFQYWDPAANAPAYNDGKDGLFRLDFILHEARKRDLLVLLVLTNNWRDFGGMDQYLTWYGLSQHHLFYTEPRVKAAYKAWVSYLISRTNSIDGTPYQSDEAIFAWELANEPRTINYKGFDSQAGWDDSTIARWAEEMASHIQALDPHHLVSVGDEGFLSGKPGVFGYDAPFGVDSEKLTVLPSVDFGTYHLYPLL